MKEVKDYDLIKEINKHKNKSDNDFTLAMYQIINKNALRPQAKHIEYKPKHPISRLDKRVDGLM